MIEYVWWSADSELPQFDGPVPFRVLVIVEQVIPLTSRALVCRQLLDAGARYVCVWGHDCEAWHDEFDQANLDRVGPEMTDEEHVMTTSHEDETLADAMFFLKRCAGYITTDIERSMIFHIAASTAEAMIVELHNVEELH